MSDALSDGATPLERLIAAILFRHVTDIGGGRYTMRMHVDDVAKEIAAALAASPDVPPQEKANEETSPAVFQDVPEVRTVTPSHDSALHGLRKETNVGAPDVPQAAPLCKWCAIGKKPFIAGGVPCHHGANQIIEMCAYTREAFERDRMGETGDRLAGETPATTAEGTAQEPK